VLVRITTDLWYDCLAGEDAQLEPREEDPHDPARGTIGLPRSSPAVASSGGSLGNRRPYAAEERIGAPALAEAMVPPSRTTMSAPSSSYGRPYAAEERIGAFALADVMAPSRTTMSAASSSRSPAPIGRLPAVASSSAAIARASPAPPPPPPMEVPMPSGWQSRTRLGQPSIPQPQAFADEDIESGPDTSSENGEQQTEVIVGPTHLAVAPMRLEQQWLPQRSHGSDVITMVPIRSGPRCVTLLDIRRLSAARSVEAPLSFGSVLHLAHGPNRYCRPCMFERWPGRCNKSPLCDFCHFHVRQKRAPRSNPPVGKAEARIP
jgi:hypothetical protein